MTKTELLVSKSELSTHKTKSDSWIAIDGQVYDVSNFAKKHPGGEKLMLFYGGQDASDAFHSFHIRPERSHALMRTMRVGSLVSDALHNNALSKESSKLSGLDTPLLRDFRQLRAQFRKEGYFEANVAFFMSYFAHVVGLELFAAYLAYFGSSSSSWWACVVVLAVAQIQAGWLQHDFGHLAVFKSIKANDLWHKITIMHMKGASAQWWKTRHNRHHAKTNVLNADPDIDNDPLFLLGEKMLDSRKGWKLTKYQHVYWWFIGPPLVTSFLFIYQVVKFIHYRKLHQEKLWIMSYFARYLLTFVPAFGFWNAVALYFSMRVIESMWFTWITSMSHLPMKIDVDDDADWITHTVATTQNLAGGPVNDWITGHLNYQVEHHLFPTMPRHSYPEITDRVKALCKKHGLDLRTRSLPGAAWDIVVALRETGELYDHHKPSKAKKQK